MKRIALIIGTLLLLAVGILVSIFWIRKSKAEQQLVSNQSTQIISIAVDDMVVDNLSSLLSWNTSSSEGERKEKWLKKIVFDAGIYIPSRIFLFNQTAKKDSFYGIVALESYDDCFTFFANHFPEEMNFIDKEKGIVHVAVSKYFQLIFDREHVVYSFSMKEDKGFQELANLLRHRERWTTVATLKGFEALNAKKHIAYVQKDQKLKIEATINNGVALIQGQWKLQKELKSDFQVQDLAADKEIIRCWNLLDAAEIPLFANILRDFSGLQPPEFNKHYGNYFDLQVNDDYFTQHDTSIAYVYDDDFNATEEKQVNDVQVPKIIQAWKYDATWAQELPDRLFYKFYTYNFGGYLFQSTASNLSHTNNLIKTAYPFYAFVDFGKMPESWDIPLLQRLKKAQVKAKLKTKVQTSNTLSLEGKITY